MSQIYDERGKASYDGNTLSITKIEEVLNQDTGMVRDDEKTYNADITNGVVELY